MILLAHSENEHGWGLPVEPWEIHPALNHFPIAFLVGGVVLDLYAWWRGRPSLVQVATGLLVAGLCTGVLTALAGLLAFFTVPAHTEETHRALSLFAWPTWERWRSSSATLSATGRGVVLLAAVVLLIGSGLGGYLVYHGGTGVDPELLAPSAQEHQH